MSLRTALLGDVCNINPPAPKNLSDDLDVSFLPMAAVSEEGHIDFEETRSFGEVKKGYTYFERDDVLIAKITPCFENGKATRTNNLQTQIGFGSTEFHVLRTSADADPSYVFHTVWNSSFRELGARNMTGSAGQKRVPADFLRRLAIPLPPLGEQRRIAAILDKADALRRKRKRALDLLDGLTQSIFMEMLGGQLWPERTLKDAVKVGTIVTYGIVQAGPEYENGVPYIRTGDIIDGQIKIDQLRHTDPEIAARFARSRVEAGEIVMSIRATVGTTAIVPDDLDGANLTQGTARIAPGEGVTPEYLLYFIRSSTAQRWIKDQVKGATFLEITLGRLRELPVAIPPLNLQREFSKRVSRVKAEFDVAASQFAEFDSLFASLQARAFSGRL